MFLIEKNGCSLDVSEAQQYMTGNQGRFFLKVLSKGGIGEIKNFSLMDYTQGEPAKETVCEDLNVPIEVGTNLLSIPIDLTALSQEHKNKPENSLKLKYVDEYVHYFLLPVDARGKKYSH